MVASNVIGNRCDLCSNFFVESKSFLSFQTSKKYTIHSRLSWDSKKYYLFGFLQEMWFAIVVCNMWDLPLLILELGFVRGLLECSVVLIGTMA